MPVEESYKVIERLEESMWILESNNQRLEQLEQMLIKLQERIERRKQLRDKETND